MEIHLLESPHLDQFLLELCNDHGKFQPGDLLDDDLAGRDDLDIRLGDLEWPGFEAPLEEVKVPDVKLGPVGKVQRIDQRTLTALIVERWKAQSGQSALAAEGRVPGPAMDLPNEIVTMIFGHCPVDKDWSLAPISEETWESEAKAEVARVMGGDLCSFSQVCHQWREVALGTPALWSTINLDLRCWSLPAEARRADFLHDVMMDRLADALKRTRQNLLTINVHGVGECRPEALAAVAAVSHRWRSAKITIETIMLDTLAPISGNLPFLQNVTIQGLNEDEDVISEAMQYFSTAPLLRRVEFCGPAKAVAHMPLEQIELLWYKGVGGPDLSHVCSQMARLPTGSALHIPLDFECIAEVSLPAGLEILPVVSYIAELNTYSYGHEGVDTEAVFNALFTKIRLPELKRLTISGAPADEDSLRPLLWAHSSMLQLVQNAGSNLRLLALPDVQISERELLDVLAAVPALEHLLISDQVPEHHLITDTLLDALSHTESNTPALIPNLSTLIFRSLQAFTVPALLQLLISRTTAASDDLECRLAWFPHRRFSGMSLDCIIDLRENLGKRGGPGLLWSCGEFDREG
ncbi:hypothetical protein FB45DRAFT_1052415 [Roridomyces roridus]|uniref:F-box domain-containing protein n=1 Tax=Roridomyces roridus TaxID=1738132 RepID=A0AAD7CGL8_9AGAR|nr:hypothetical protein FB45DRAFT_1052415 [Roridomyces roridus]